VEKPHKEPEGTETVPQPDTYAYWAGLGISLGSIVTSIVNAVVFLITQDPLTAIRCAVVAGLATAIFIDTFYRPQDLR